jgi:hypothetical protein
LSSVPPVTIVLGRLQHVFLGSEWDPACQMQGNHIFLQRIPNHENSKYDSLLINGVAGIGDDQPGSLLARKKSDVYKFRFGISTNKYRSNTAIALAALSNR